MLVSINRIGSIPVNATRLVGMHLGSVVVECSPACIDGFVARQNRIVAETSYVVRFQEFEQKVLRLAFTTKMDLSPAACAFVTGVSVREATKHMTRLVDEGLLELDSDESGRLTYTMPDRPDSCVTPWEQSMCSPRDTHLITAVVPTSTALPTGQALGERRCILDSPAIAALSLVLNGLVCPGLGSMVGGKTTAGMAQLALFMFALPLVTYHIGLPLLLVAWAWSIGTSGTLMTESAGVHQLKS